MLLIRTAIVPLAKKAIQTYHEETEEAAVVFAVLHGSQNPDRWRSRLS